MLSRAEAVTHLQLASELAGLDVDEVSVPTDHHIVVNGLRLHYLDWGQRECPPLLFLHGGRLTAHTWDLVCLALCADFRCLAVDQRGRGDSEWSPVLAYEPDAHARDIGGLIHALELQRPVLIGQSLGGLNAMTYATRAASQLAGVVLLDVGSDVQSKGAKRITSFVAEPGPGTLEDFVERARLHNPRRDPRLLRYSLLHNLRRLPDHSWTWKYDPRRITPEHYASLMSSLEELRDHAHTITCPVLVMRGAESDVLTDAQAASFAAELPDARWVRVEAAGHNIQSDNPRGVIQALTDFLTEIGHSDEQTRVASASES